MERNKERHYLSLSKVLLATILGGAVGFLLFVWDSEDAASRSFLQSDEGFAWLVVMVAQSAVWGLFFVLTWKKTLFLLIGAFKHHQRLRIISSLTLYLAAYMLLLWFPQQLVKNISSNELPGPLERNVPLAHFPVKNAIFFVVQVIVILLPVAGMWLADWRVRNGVILSGSEEECFSVFYEARSYLLNIGAVLTTLMAFSFLGLVLWGKALKPFVHFHWFSRPPLVIYGLYLTALVAIPYIPAYLNLLSAGRDLCDRFYPRLLPRAADYENRDARRKRVDEMLGLPMQVREGIKILTTILVPVVTSLVYAFLGLKQ